MKVLASLLVAVTLASAMNLGMATGVDAKKPGTLVVPLTGTVAGGGTFSGTLSIDRFEAQAGAIQAVGMIAGVVTGVTGPVGSVVHGPLALPVTVSGSSLAVGTRVIAQQQQCDVLHLQIGGVTLDLLGLDVTLSPVTLDLVGGTGPLGSLICEIVALLDNVVAVVGLLNQLLGLVTDLLGGITP